MLSHESDCGERTAFREAEKKYQQHFEQVFRQRYLTSTVPTLSAESQRRQLSSKRHACRKGRLKGTGVRSIQTDLSAVIDFRNPATWRGVVLQASNSPEEAYCLSNRPGEADPAEQYGRNAVHLVLHLFFDTHFDSCWCAGFCFIASGVTEEEQQRLIVDSLTRFLQSPAATNHSERYGELPDLWESAQGDRVLVEAAEEHLPTADGQRRAWIEHTPEASGHHCSILCTRADQYILYKR